jgi:hypothetical protein
MKPMDTRSKRWIRIALATALGLGLGPAAQAQNGVLFSPDITAPLGTVGPATVADDDAATDDAAGTVTPVLLTMLGAAVPVNTEVAGLELSSSIPAALSLDITAPLPGLPVVSPAVPQDVVSWDPNTDTYSLTFDGSVNGVPPNARIDAVSRNTAGDLLLSFDITLALPGVGIVDDEDLVEFSGGLFSMEFDGSANGIAAGLDLDAASRETETSGDLLLSFDGSGITPGGFAFDDEDTLRFDPGLGTWTMFADASASDPVDWPATDLVALPEPGFAASLLAGATSLALLSKGRAARRRRARSSGRARGSAG